MGTEYLLEELIKKIEEQDAAKWFRNYHINGCSRSYSATQYSIEIGDLKIDVAWCSKSDKRSRTLWEEYVIFVNNLCIFKGEGVKKLWEIINEKVEKYEQQKEEERAIGERIESQKERQEILEKLIRII